MSWEFEDYMCYLPVFILIGGMAVYFSITEGWSFLFWFGIGISIFTLAYYWSKYWVDRKYAKHGNNYGV